MLFKIIFIKRIPGPAGEILRYGHLPLDAKGPEPSPALKKILSLPPVEAEMLPLRRTPSGLFAAEEAQMPALNPSVAALARLRGVAVHRLLQELPAREKAERISVARRLFALPQYQVLAEQVEDLIDETLAILDAPEFAALFGPGSRAEVPIAGALHLANGRRLFVSGQIDRLIITETRIHILDYKTNRETPRAVPRAYIAQMAAYASLLREIFPRRAIDAALLFTAEPRLVPLSESEISAIDITQIAETA